MALTICILASGSKGNCVLVRSSRANILIDDGIGPRILAGRLAQVGLKGGDIDAVLVTHAHSDHVSGLSSFLAKFAVPVYAPYSVAEGMLRSDKTYPTLNPWDGGDFFVKDVTVSPFSVPHDVPCYGYSLYCSRKKVSVATDLGEASDYLLEDICDSDLVVLESNHDVEMLRANPHYSARLKARILSGRGHLSNDACAEAAAKLLRGSVRQGRPLKQIVLAHLSEQNNDPLIALRAITERLARDGVVVGRDVLVDVARQDCISKLYET